MPHIGKRVNGSQRWISLGFMTLQVSEIAKCAAVVFFAGYLVRRRDEMYASWYFGKPFLVLIGLAFLLLAEPDFGATVVIGLSTLSLLFLAGAASAFCHSWCWRYSLQVLVVTESYRFARLMAFVDPWDEADVKVSGYQLTQSLIAIARGEWLGVGLGHSVQKLFYLPEAHTDFVFSIWAEESVSWLVLWMGCSPHWCGACFASRVWLLIAVKFLALWWQWVWH